MFKKLFLAAAIAIVSQSFVAAQDIFWSFSPTTLETTFSGGNAGTGSAYIFSGRNFGFDAMDLDFTVSDPSVIRFTGGEVFNPTFTTIGGTRFDLPSIDVDTPVGDTGNLFLVNVIQNGIDPVTGPLFDPGFDPGVGPNGAFLLARVDFEILTVGTTQLEFNLGTQGAIVLPASTLLDPTFGFATFSTEGFTFTLGDINNDGAVDFLDFAPFIFILSNYRYQSAADCNQDGAVDFLDIEPFIAIVSSQ